MTLHRTLAATITTVALSCLAVSAPLPAATAPQVAPIITYTAAGTFASVPLSGADTLKLQAEPFNVSVSVSASTIPFKYGPNWAAYHQLKLIGTVHSGLLGPTPVNIVSNEASIIQAISPGLFDQFTIIAPVKVVGISLTITAVVVMPIGTVKKPLLYPFPGPIAMDPTNSTVTYTDGLSSTVLAVQKGALTGTIPGGVANALQIAYQPHAAQRAVLPRRRDMI